MRISRPVLAALLVATTPLVATPALAQTEATENEAVDEANLALARQIVGLGFPEDAREAMFFGTVDQMVLQARQSMLGAYGVDDEGLVEVLDTWIAEYVADSKVTLAEHIPDLMDGMAKAYANTFTQGELTDVLAFVSTPSGQRFFELSSAIISEPNFANANQAYMDDVNGQLPSAIQDLQGRIAEHLSKRASRDQPDES